MDYLELINALRVRVQQIEAAIVELELLKAPSSPEALLAELQARTGRVRKFMPRGERQQVSEGMKRYWAKRRKP